MTNVLEIPEAPTKTQEKVLEIVRALGERLAPMASRQDELGDVSAESYDYAHELGYLRLTLAEDYGGHGADPLTFCAAQYALSQYCAGTTLAMTMHLATIGLLQGLLQGKQRDDVLGLIGSKKVILAGGGTENESGGTWGSAPPGARVSDAGIVANVRKRFSSGASVATHFFHFITVADEHDRPPVAPYGPSCFLVPADTEGVRVEPTWNSLGMRASGSHDVVYENALLPADAMIGGLGKGWAKASRFSYWFLLGETATYLGVAAAAISTAAEYAKRKYREQNSNGSGTVAQMTLGEMQTKLEAARAFLFQEARSFLATGAGKGGYTSGLLGRASMVKLFATTAAIEIANSAMNLCGGFSYLKGSSTLERHYRDARGGPFHPPRNSPTALLLAGRTVLGADLAT